MAERMLADSYEPDNYDDGGPYTIGARFTPTVPGYLARFRYYARHYGDHTLTLWRVSDQAKLVSMPTSSTGAGWIEVRLTEAFPLEAGVTYAVTRSTNGQWYPYSTSTPASAAPDLTGFAGCYASGDDVFPETVGSTYHYLLDVVFQLTPAIENSGVSWAEAIPLTPGPSGSITVPFVEGNYQSYYYTLDVSAYPLRYWDFHSGADPGLYWDIYSQLVPYTDYLDASRFGAYGTVGFYAVKWDGTAVPTLYIQVYNQSNTVVAPWTWTSQDPPPPRPYYPEQATPINVEVAGSIAWDAIAQELGGRYYSFTPSTDCFVTFDAPYRLEGWLYWEVYSGTSWDDSEWIDGQYEDGPYGIALEAGVPYFLYLATDDLELESDTGTLSWEPAAAVDPPAYVVPNDLFAHAITIDVSAPGTFSYDNTGATQTDVLPQYLSSDKRDIWYKLVNTSDRVVSFTFHPSGSATRAPLDAAYIPSTAIYRRNDVAVIPGGDDKWHWVSEDSYPLQPGLDYVLQIAFPSGNQGLWDPNGSMSWTSVKAPPNATQHTATDLSAAVPDPVTGVIPVATVPYSGYMQLWIKVTAGADGGFMVVFGDGHTPYPAGASIYGYVYSEANALAVPFDGSKTLGVVQWSNTEVAGALKFVRDGKVGDVYYILISTHNWPSSTIPLRMGVGTEITWGEWLPTDSIRAGQEEYDPRPEPFYPVPLLLGSYYLTLPDEPTGEPGYFINGYSWSPQADQRTPGHPEVSWGGDAEYLRSIVESGHNLSDGDVGQVGTAFHWAGIGMPAPEYGGYNLADPNGNVAQNEYKMVVSASTTLHGWGLHSTTLDYLKIGSFEDFMWWVEHWFLYTSQNWDLPRPPSSGPAFKQELQAMRMEFDHPIDEPGGVHVWEVNSKVEWNWTRQATTPVIWGIDVPLNDPFTIEVREGTYPVDTEFPERSTLQAMPIAYEITVPTGAADNAMGGSGIVPTAYHFDYFPVQRFETFDWEAAYRSTLDDPYFSHEKAFFHVLSFYTRQDPLDVPGIIDAMLEANIGGWASWPFWTYRGIIGWNPGLMVRYPPNFRLGTFVEDWSGLGQEPGGGSEVPAGYFVQATPNLGGAPDAVAVNFA